MANEKRLETGRRDVEKHAPVANWLGDFDSEMMVPRQPLHLQRYYLDLDEVSE